MSWKKAIKMLTASSEEGITVKVSPEKFAKLTIKNQNYILLLGLLHLQGVIKYIILAVAAVFLIVVIHIGPREVIKEIRQIWSIASAITNLAF
jgi:hypothetical protein